MYIIKKKDLTRFIEFMKIAASYTKIFVLMHNGPIQSEQRSAMFCLSLAFLLFNLPVNVDAGHARNPRYANLSRAGNPFTTVFGPAFH